MQHVRMAIYDLTSGTFDEVRDRARDGMVPVFERQGGLLGYGLADAGNGSAVSLSFWRSPDDADAASKLAADFVRTTLADRMQLRENYVGDIDFLTSTSNVGSAGHARTAVYELSSGSFEEVRDRARDGMVPIFERQGGLLGYGVADAGNGSVVSLSFWRSAADAEEAATLAADWVRDNLAERFQLRANLVGRIDFLVPLQLD